MSSSRDPGELHRDADGLRDLDRLADVIGARAPSEAAAHVLRVDSDTFSGLQAGDASRPPAARRSAPAWTPRPRSCRRAHRAVQFSGSMGACARYGTSYTASIFLARAGERRRGIALFARDRAGLLRTLGETSA